MRANGLFLPGSCEVAHPHRPSSGWEPPLRLDAQRPDELAATLTGMNGPDARLFGVQVDHGLSDDLHGLAGFRRGKSSQARSQEHGVGCHDTGPINSALENGVEEFYSTFIKGIIIIG